ncbi:MAG: alkaline phosphatase family protein, partial [Bacillota bacterium]
PFELFIPTSKNLKAETIWDKLSKADKRSVVMNVPLTYPPKKIKGNLVSGFLATDINKATYPKNLANELKEMDYIIDADTWLVRDSKEKFLKELNYALERRFKTMFKLMGEKDWDYFHCHIMETDRINHFYWGDMIDENEKFLSSFYDFYKKIDDYLGKLMDRINKDTQLIILSDHGFTKIKKEVQLNYFLEEKGYLKYNIDRDKVESIGDISAETKAYSLIPGRIFINRKGREEMGTVKAKEYFELREKLKEELLELENKENGEKIIKDVYFREEIYNGPYLEQAADLIAIPNRGYDLKGKAAPEKFFEKNLIQGMHTFDDAFVYLKDNEQDLNLDDVKSIRDINPIILDYFNI